MSQIYLSPPDVGPEEREQLLAAFDSNWIAPLGPAVDAFEADFARRHHVPEAAALSSGTAALHLALVLLGISRGDRVLVSSLTFAATANAVLYVGAEPGFVDCERRSWNIDPDLLEEAIVQSQREGRPPKAVIVVDLYGQCAEYSRIVPLCERYGVPIIEDAAEALGATCDGRPAGSFGALGVFSFNGNKIITTSGGGMLISERVDLIKKARWLAAQAREPLPHYEHKVTGYNYRLSNLLAGLGRAQLANLDNRVAKRRAINKRYRDQLGELPGVDFTPIARWGTPNGWLTTLTIDPALFGAGREDVRLALERQQIEARPVWKPMHLQPVFAASPHWGAAVSEDLFSRGLCLPSGSSLTDTDLSRVIDAVQAVQRV